MKSMKFQNSGHFERRDASASYVMLPYRLMYLLRSIASSSPVSRSIMPLGTPMRNGSRSHVSGARSTRGSDAARRTAELILPSARDAISCARSDLMRRSMMSAFVFSCAVISSGDFKLRLLSATLRSSAMIFGSDSAHWRT